MRKTFVIIILALWVCNLKSQISEWREENRTGVSAETGLLKTWPAEGPALIWSTLELTKGYSSVSFGNGLIYTTGIDGENDILYALEVNGTSKWKAVMGRAWKESYPESRATPTVEGKFVYTCSGFGDLACFDGITGKMIWSYKASESNKGTYGRWGIAESLIIDGDKIYFSPGGPETMTIAINKKTGAPIWKSASIGDKPGYISPVLVQYAGYKMILNASQGHLFAVNAENGDILWKVPHHQSGDPGRELIKCATPLYKDGMVYVTGGYDTGGMMVKMAADGKSANIVWTDATLDNHHGGVVLIDGYIYGANWINNGNGNWVCLDWNTGKTMWEQKWNNKGSIISAEGMLYLYDEKGGNVGLVKVSPEKFDLVSSFKVNLGDMGPHWAHPVIHNGILYLRHSNALMAYDIKAR